MQAKDAAAPSTPRGVTLMPSVLMHRLQIVIDVLLRRRPSHKEVSALPTGPDWASVLRFDHLRSLLTQIREPDVSDAVVEKATRQFMATEVALARQAGNAIVQAQDATQSVRGVLAATREEAQALQRAAATTSTVAFNDTVGQRLRSCVLLLIAEVRQLTADTALLSTRIKSLDELIQIFSELCGEQDGYGVTGLRANRQSLELEIDPWMTQELDLQLTPEEFATASDALYHFWQEVQLPLFNDIPGIKDEEHRANLTCNDLAERQRTLEQRVQALHHLESPDFGQLDIGAIAGNSVDWERVPQLLHQTAIDRQMHFRALQDSVQNLGRVCQNLNGHLAWIAEAAEAMDRYTKFWTLALHQDPAMAQAQRVLTASFYLEGVHGDAIGRGFRRVIAVLRRRQVIPAYLEDALIRWGESEKLLFGENTFGVHTVYRLTPLGCAKAQEWLRQMGPHNEERLRVLGDIDSEVTETMWMWDLLHEERPVLPEDAKIAARTAPTVVETCAVPSKAVATRDATQKTVVDQPAIQSVTKSAPGLVKEIFFSLQAHESVMTARPSRGLYWPEIVFGMLAVARTWHSREIIIGLHTVTERLLMEGYLDQINSRSDTLYRLTPQGEALMRTFPRLTGEVREEYLYYRKDEELKARWSLDFLLGIPLPSRHSLSR